MIFIVSLILKRRFRPSKGSSIPNVGQIFLTEKNYVSIRLPPPPFPISSMVGDTFYPASSAGKHAGAEKKTPKLVSEQKTMEDGVVIKSDPDDDRWVLEQFESGHDDGGLDAHKEEKKEGEFNLYEVENNKALR